MSSVRPGVYKPNRKNTSSSATYPPQTQIIHVQSDFDINYIYHRYLLGSMVKLVPLPKMSLLMDAVFTQHEAPQHKLSRVTH